MPDLARIGKINRLCPKASHWHRQASISEIKMINQLKRTHLIGYQSYCAICSTQYNDTLNLNWKCPNFKYIERRPLPEKSKRLLTLIFNNHPVFFLPELLHDKIFTYASIYYIDTIKNINDITINHLFNCTLCAEKTLRWINYNTCTKHILPRPPERPRTFTRFA